MVNQAGAVSDDTQDEILDLLAEGYGVEDIAVMMEIEVQGVRAGVVGMLAGLRRDVCREGG